MSKVMVGLVAPHRPEATTSRVSRPCVMADAAMALGVVGSIVGIDHVTNDPWLRGPALGMSLGLTIKKSFTSGSKFSRRQIRPHIQSWPIEKLYRSRVGDLIRAPNTPSFVWQPKKMGVTRRARSRPIGAGPMGAKRGRLRYKRQVVSRSSSVTSRFERSLAVTVHLERIAPVTRRTRCLPALPAGFRGETTIL